MEKHLLIRAYLGLSRKISKKEEITLEFIGFRSDVNTAVLAFKIEGSIVLQKAILIGIKRHEFISMKDDELVLDLYKLKIHDGNMHSIDYIKSLRDVKVDFKPNTISVMIKLLHDNLSV